MNNSQHSREERAGAADRQPTRRAFLLTAAGACGALAAWSLHGPEIASAASGSKTPGVVTIVEFGANGKPTGKVKVPRMVKTDAEWQQQLSPYLLPGRSPGRHGAALHG